MKTEQEGSGMEIDVLITRYLAGEATEEEKVAIKKWAAKAEDNARVLKSFEQLISADLREERLIFSDNSFNKLHQRLNRGGSVDWRGSKADWRFNLMRIAAAVLFLAVAIWTVLTFLYSPQAAPEYHAEYVVKSNPAGQRSLIYLPDGSTLWLNAESSIRYEKDFHDSVRWLKLTGEAFFMVKKDTLKPFMVQVDKILVTALGTDFNVHAYEESDAIYVALQSGKVKVQKYQSEGDTGVFLHPGEMASVPRGDNVIEVNDFEVMKTLLWKEGVLHFKDAEFDEVITKLERWYGVQFEYKGRPDKSWHFTSTFRNEYLENILETLAFSERLKYEIVGDTVKLKF